MDGVVRMPSLFSSTLAEPPSMMATQEFVVPRSIPITSPCVLSRRLAEALKKPLRLDRTAASAWLDRATCLATGAIRIMRDIDISSRGNKTQENTMRISKAHLSQND